MSQVEIRDILKEYGDTVANDNISFEIEDGEFISILGPSGSGKTTLLKIISGFEEPTAGAVYVGGEEVTHLEPEDRDTSLVFQRLALFPHMDVGENISFGLKMKTDMSSTEIRNKVKEVLDLVELPGYEDRSIHNLSGGEQQRVALARAIVTEPNLLLYDEPLSDLDKKLREKMRREMAKLHDLLDITSIHVTHNQKEAMALADRVAVLDKGQLMQYDTPGNIYNEPNNRFVADFIGEANLISGSVVEDDQKIHFENGMFDVELSPDQLENGAANETLLVRPENIRLVDINEGGHLRGEITDAVHLGSITEYHMNVGMNESLIIRDVGDIRFQEGETKSVVLDDYSLIQDRGKTNEHH